MSEKTQLKRALQNLTAELDEIESSVGILARRTEGFTEQVKQECNELEEKLGKVEKAVENLNERVDNGKITRTEGNVTDPTGSKEDFRNGKNKE